MSNSFFYFWGKASRDGNLSWHPLILHLLDVAAVADALLDREPDSTKTHMSGVLGVDWGRARPWILLLIACHDLGKASPGFQRKWLHFDAVCAPHINLNFRRHVNSAFNHAYVSQVALESLLCEMGFSQQMSSRLADAVGCHHGVRALSTQLNELMNKTSASGDETWVTARKAVFELLKNVFGCAETPPSRDISGNDFLWLSGLTSFADWMGSDDRWFSYGRPEDCEDLSGWFSARRQIAEAVLDAAGWAARTPILEAPTSFEALFGFAPRPLQSSVAECVSNLEKPSVILVEAPMGEGKTEAAFYAHAELQRRFGHRGMYIALPTKATGNAMFERALSFIRGRALGRSVDMQLLHGGAMMNESYQSIRATGIYGDDDGSDVRASEWFSQKKRGLLSEYGVGTIDQALLSVLPVKHYFVRLWGLSNRVVVFDEIHAYDAYTGTLLVHLIEWLVSMGSSVILLSATLPPQIREAIAASVGAVTNGAETPYPRLTVFSRSEAVRQVSFKADEGRRMKVAIKRIGCGVSDIKNAVDSYCIGNVKAMALVNTVQRAQDLYALYPSGAPIIREGVVVGKRLANGVEVYLFHARFPAQSRQQRENAVLDVFGKTSDRACPRILIATQVAEQSLDLDFDVIATDLAPVDLLLQRLGRLWRHFFAHRPIDCPVFIVSGLDGEEPPSFESPLWWSSVYRADILLRTWNLLRSKAFVTVPDDIDAWVNDVYAPEDADVVDQRLEQASDAGIGKELAERAQAHRAAIGSPHDGSWRNPILCVLNDENTADMHRALTAQTRLGEPSVVVIPVFPTDVFSLDAILSADAVRCLYLRCLSVSRRSVIGALVSLGVPTGWTTSPILRNCYPLILDSSGRWKEDSAVRLDDELGLVYEKKENA